MYIECRNEKVGKAVHFLYICDVASTIKFTWIWNLSQRMIIYCELECCGRKCWVCFGFRLVYMRQAIDRIGDIPRNVKIKLILNEQAMIAGAMYFKDCMLVCI